MLRGLEIQSLPQSVRNRTCVTVLILREPMLRPRDQLSHTWVLKTDAHLGVLILPPRKVPILSFQPLSSNALTPRHV